MTHDAHEAMPGYTPWQLLHSGCGECQARSAEYGGGLAHLDRTRFAIAWARAHRWKTEGLDDLDPAEIPLLETLWLVQDQLAKFGITHGQFPVAPSALPRRKDRHL